MHYSAYLDILGKELVYGEGISTLESVTKRTLGSIAYWYCKYVDITGLAFIHRRHYTFC